MCFRPLGLPPASGPPDAEAARGECNILDSGVHKGGFSKGYFSNLCVSLVQL